MRETAAQMSADLLVAVTIIALLVLAVVLQRLTGVGFAMMLAPFVVVMIGPHAGVMLTNVLAIVAPALVVPLVWKDIEWSKLAIIVPAALAVMPLFGWLAAATPQGPLYIVVAVLVILGLSVSLVASRSSRAVDGGLARGLTGAGVGAGVVLAGVGGPAITIYTVLSRWRIRTFAATMQPMWVMVSIGGFGTKWAISGDEFPAFPWWFWVGCLAAILTGLLIAHVIRPWVSDLLARRTVIVLAFVGALTSLGMGIGETLG